MLRLHRWLPPLRCAACVLARCRGDRDGDASPTGPSADPPGATPLTSGSGAIDAGEAPVPPETPLPHKLPPPSGPSRHVEAPRACEVTRPESARSPLRALRSPETGARPEGDGAASNEDLDVDELFGILGPAQANYGGMGLGW